MKFLDIQIDAKFADEFECEFRNHGIECGARCEHFSASVTDFIGWLLEAPPFGVVAAMFWAWMAHNSKRQITVVQADGTKINLRGFSVKEIEKIIGLHKQNTVVVHDEEKPFCGKDSQ